MNINYLDFLEIGACIGTESIYKNLQREYNHDFIFMTSIADRVPEGVYGFSIEPVKNYLDYLNAPNTINKLNCAISDKDSEADIFYVSVEDAIANNLYSWIIGCASLDKPDEKLIKHLEEKKCIHLLKKDRISVRNINYLVELYNIQSIEYLKIDTEGEDYKILLSLFNSNRPIAIDKIQFESYFINNKLLEIKNYLKSKNYIELYGGHDTFFINSNSLSRILTYPNILDQIFIQDIRFNLDIKNFQKYN
jgi:FkbM family methyltransferase